MRSTFVSVALLALAHSLAPGVHGAPAVVSDHTNSLAVRQGLASCIPTLDGLLSSILGSAPSIPQVPGLSEEIAQKLQEIAASGIVARAPSSDSTSSTSFTTLSSTTTSQVLAVATDQTGTSTVSSVSGASLSTPQASSTPPTRMRRQLSLPTAVLSTVGSKIASLPVPSVAASTLSAVLGSVTSQSATIKSTSSSTSVSTSQV